MKLIDKAKLPLFNSSKPKNKKITSLLYDIQIRSIDGSIIDLSTFNDKKILFVNVASKCGFTNQYNDLQKLNNLYSHNLVIIGSPCNQFGSQEPGNASQIQSFCKKNYGVTFLITEKIDVKGKNQHPLYGWLTQKEQNGIKNSSVKWNFQKYLVDKNGKLIDYYYSTTKPMSSKITKHLK
ncbi:glutathione peroxidase [Aquimarina muelleri]|uniref:Glutathione peroxidase n=1 Tax=Aquimarina muelleri TaxID=279356 RepID=A0A918JWY1_9FLAO|nr:glutathione peroxidase [Aquimarina muelleri]MCX2762537.1 glutathione peroxidase [Aquimarina muelleri]GGX24363.1 glutathione peroxidase [Aquimarina muelleri]